MASRRIGIRELRQSLSETIRHVEKGETIEVTRDGEPVALIRPVPREASTLDQLVAEGRARQPTGSLEEFLKLPRLQNTTGVTASEALQEDRGD